MKPTLFLVDELAPDGTYGRAMSLKKILHNLAQMPVGVPKHLNKRLNQKATEVTLFLPTGRYVCAMSFFGSQTHGVMEFFNTRNADMVAYRIADSFANALLRHHFMLCHLRLKRNYLQNFNDASIALSVTSAVPLPAIHHSSVSLAAV